MTTQQQEPIQKPNPTPKPKQPKSPNPPPKDKILINLKSLGGPASTKFQDILAKSNNKDYGASVTPTDIFTRAILKLSDADIQTIQRASIKTDLDLLKYEWSKDQHKTEEKTNFNAWLLKKLKLKTNHKEMQ